MESQQESLGYDVVHFVQPYLSLEKIRETRLKRMTPPDEDAAQLFVEADADMWGNALSSVRDSIGLKLTTLVVRYLQKMGYQHAKVRSEASGEPDSNFLYELWMYARQILRTHLGVSHGDGLDAGRLSTELRTVMRIVSPEKMLIENTSVRVYDDNRHYYVPLHVEWGSFWTTLTTRVLNIKTTRTLEGDTLLNLARLARRRDFSEANMAYITVGNGDLNLASFEIEGYSASHFTTMAYPIAPTENQTIPPAWKQFFDGQWPDDPKTVQFLIRWMSVHFLKDNVGVFVITHNEGGGGKTLYNNGIREMLSPELTASIPADKFSGTFGPEMLLQSDRMTTKPANIVDENSKKLPWNFLKSTADKGAYLTLDRKNTSAITIPFNTKMTFATNTLPSAGDDVEQTYAVKRKVRLVVFPKSFQPDEMDETLGQRMIDELDDLGGVMLHELKKMRDEGSFTPVDSPFMIDEKEKWFASMTQDTTPVSAFISDKLVRDIGKRLSRSDLMVNFKLYLEETGTASEGYERPKKFWKKFREVLPKLLGVSSDDTKSGNEFYFNDISLNFEEGK